MRTRFRLFLFYITVLLSCAVRAATIPFIPQVFNYSVNVYKAGNQNWAVGQDARGNMYFGNNRGLLRFDGIRWTLHKLPSHTAVRSLYVGKDERIYVGSFEEFGYFDATDKGELVYHSLKKYVTDHIFSNDEIWTIREHRGKIYFQSFSSYFIYDGEGVKKGYSLLPPLYFFSLNDQLYAQFIAGGFFREKEGGFTELIPRDRLKKDDVVAVFPYEDKLLLVTAMNGLFLYGDGSPVAWNVPVGDLLKAGIANRGEMLKDSTYVVGTISDGVIAFDKKGALLWHINRENHLINNTVLGLCADRFDNLWVALDNGISRIQVNSPLYFYEPLEAPIGMVHDVVIGKDNVYLATNQGVYMLSDKQKLPQLIPGTKEQTWYVTDLGNQQIIAGHNKGTLLIEKEKAGHIPGPGVGGTVLRKCIIHGKEILLQASYSVLSVFTRTGAGKWQFSHNVEGFDNPIKSFEVDLTGNIWASHMHRGIYRMSLDESLKKVKELTYIDKADPANERGIMNVMKLRGRILLTDGKRFYTHEDLSNLIVPYDLLNSDFPEISDAYRIVPLNNDLFWFIRDSEYVLLSYEKGRFFAKLRIPFTLFDNPTIEDRGNIYVDSEGVSYFCLDGGLARYNPFWLKTDTVTTSLALSSVKVHNRHMNTQLLLPCFHADSLKVEVLSGYPYKTITFEFAYPDYTERGHRLLYKLTGFDDEWSECSSDYVKSYSNLPYGSYTLQAMIQNETGDKIISSLSYAFKIKPPFYRSPIALIVYFVLTVFLFLLLVGTYISWKVAREKKVIEKERKKQEEQLKMQEQQIIKLKNEKLENELTYKSKELAGTTLTLISQNDFLEELKKEIWTQQHSGNYTKRFFEKLIRMIDDNITKEDDWAVYQANFDCIHENFFAKLKSRYPDLTSGDLRMCALLRLNMPTKDMARMLNLSVRGIEAARYRLRKKLVLAEGESLADFMIQFK